jgi:hypothetical protein
MLNSEIRKILCDQLELLAEVSKECKEKTETAVIPTLTDAMCNIAETINSF